MTKTDIPVNPNLKGRIKAGQPYPYSPELILAFVRTRERYLETANSYADAIFLLRRHLGYSVTDLATRVGSSYGVIYRAECKRSVPRPQVLRNLAKVAATRGLDNYEAVLLAESSREEDRLMERSRNASPRAD